LKRTAHHHKIIIIAVVCAIAMSAVAGVSSAGEKAKFELYGFIRFDMMFFDSQMTSSLVPLWVKNEYNGKVPKDDSAYTLHPRLTRVGMRFKAWDIDDNWKMDAGVEVDFQSFADPVESREPIRMRLAYVRLHRSDWQFMAGQHWDLISPLFPNVNLNGVNWNSGNLGDRRAQVRVTFAPDTGDGGKVYFAGALGLQGAVNASDLDANGVLDGLDATFPQLQGRFGVKQPLGESMEIKLGVWGHYAREEFFVAGSTTEKEQYEAWSSGADLTLSFKKKFKFLGELWAGENLPDVRGGIAQGIDPINKIGIRSAGGWGEIDYIHSNKVTLLGGYTIDNPKDDDLLEDDMRSKNQMAYGAVRWRPWAGSYMLSFEFMHWSTDYTGFEETSTANHVDINMMYFF
jgi:hypothetical protein